uniref:EKC/KEOPS complex subunit CGI121 n=1 Tax=Strongyloides stercoralis TaxID=6248 RepID=A0A0K0EBY4_STRER
MSINIDNEEMMFNDLFLIPLSEDDFYDGVMFCLKHRNFYMSRFTFGPELSRSVIEKRMLDKICKQSLLERVYFLSQLPVLPKISDYLKSLHYYAKKISLDPHDQCVALILAMRNMNKHEFLICKSLDWNVDEHIKALEGNCTNISNEILLKKNEEKINNEEINCKKKSKEKDTEKKIIKHLNEKINNENKSEKISTEEMSKKNLNKEFTIKEKTIDTVETNVDETTKINKQNMVCKKFELFRVDEDGLIKDKKKVLSKTNTIEVFVKCYGSKPKFGYVVLTKSCKTDFYFYEQLRSNSVASTIISKAVLEIMKHIIGYSYESFIIYTTDMHFDHFFSDLFYNTEIFSHTDSSFKNFELIKNLIQKVKQGMVVILEESTTIKHMKIAIELTKKLESENIHDAKKKEKYDIKDIDNIVKNFK